MTFLTLVKFLVYLNLICAISACVWIWFTINKWIVPIVLSVFFGMLSWYCMTH